MKKKIIIGLLILLVIAIIYKINVSVKFSNKANDYLHKISNSFL